jgi:hypothetical protein
MPHHRQISHCLNPSSVLTLMQAAARLRAPYSRVRRAALRLCNPARFGSYRLVTLADLETIRLDLARRKGVARA